MNACRSVCGPDWLGSPGAAGYPADHPRGTVPVLPTSIGGKEDRSFGALADGQVDRPRGARCERDGGDLAALAGDHQSPVPALDTQCLDVGAGGLGDPHSIERQQRDEGVLGGLAKPGDDQQRPELIASSPTAWTHSPSVDAGHGRPGSEAVAEPGVPHAPGSAAVRAGEGDGDMGEWWGKDRPRS
jgi:hypothetical protein